MNSSSEVSHYSKVDCLAIFKDLKEKVLQSQQGWGSKIIDTLSKDLKREFPNMKGFSVRNLKYMRQFTSVYSDIVIVQEILAQLTDKEKIIKEAQKLTYDRIAYKEMSLAQTLMVMEKLVRR